MFITSFESASNLNLLRKQRYAIKFRLLIYGRFASLCLWGLIITARAHLAASIFNRDSHLKIPKLSGKKEGKRHDMLYSFH